MVAALSILTGLSWFTPLYLLAIYGLVRYFVPKKAAPSSPASYQQHNPDRVAWTPLESVAVTLFIYFGAQFMGVLAALAISRVLGFTGDRVITWLDSSVYGQFLTVLLIEAISVALLLGFLKKRRTPLKFLGWFRPRWRDLGYVALGFGIYFVSFIALLSLAKVLIPALNTDQQQQIGFDNASGIGLVAVFASLVLMPAFVEEILVRGFLYTGLRSGMRYFWAALLTSVLFGLAHLQAGSDAPLLWVAALDTFTLSMVLIYLKEKTGGLAAPIGLHMLKNTIAFLTLFVFHGR